MSGSATASSMNAEDLTRAAEEESKAWAPKSFEHYQRASRSIPGGTFRIRFFWPHPIFIDRADGAYLYDLDGHQLIDCNLGFGPLVLGHNHPVVVKAVQEQLAQGAMFPNTREVDLAELMVANVPNSAWSVFFNSGTEATLAAMRVARAATGRTKIGKFEGGWHGWHDFALWNTQGTDGPPALARPVPMSAGLPAALADMTVALPYNDPAAFERIRREAADLAAVIVEPVQGAAGVIPARSDFLHELTELCRQYGILVIADEVITGFRLGPGGGCAYYGITPDLVTLGKIIGGGLPIGGMTGSEAMREVMVNGTPDGRRLVMGGTFSANPMTMAAGAAQVGLLVEGPERYEHLNALGEQMRKGLTEVAAEYGNPLTITGIGGMWGTHYGVTGEPHSVRDVGSRDDQTKWKVLHHYLSQEGVVVSAPEHLSFLSCAHTSDDVDNVIDAHRRALSRMAKEGLLTT